MMGLTSGHHPNSQCVGCESSGWPLFFPAHHLRKAHKIGKMNPSSGWSESLPCRTCTQGGGAGKISPILSTWNRKVSNTFTCMLKPSVCLQNCVPALAWISFLSSNMCSNTVSEEGLVAGGPPHTFHRTKLGQGGTGSSKSAIWRPWAKPNASPSALQRAKTPDISSEGAWELPADLLPSSASCDGWLLVTALMLFPCPRSLGGHVYF